MTSPAWPGYVARVLPRGIEGKWEAVRAETVSDPVDQDSWITADGVPLSVNAWVNRYVTYTADPRDMWQGPNLTLKLKTGDCEDYAIVKRAILLARGWPSSRLALIVGQDRGHGAHAVLWADGQVLDNLCNDPIPPAQLYGLFIPQWAFGDEAWGYDPAL